MGFLLATCLSSPSHFPKFTLPPSFPFLEGALAFPLSPLGRASPSPFLLHKGHSFLPPSFFSRDFQIFFRFTSPFFPAGCWSLFFSFLSAGQEVPSPLSSGKLPSFFLLNRKEPPSLFFFFFFFGLFPMSCRFLRFYLAPPFFFFPPPLFNWQLLSPPFPGKEHRSNNPLFSANIRFFPRPLCTIAYPCYQCLAQLSFPPPSPPPKRQARVVPSSFSPPCEI